MISSLLLDPQAEETCARRSSRTRARRSRRRVSCCATTSGGRGAGVPDRAKDSAEYHLLQFHAGKPELLQQPRPHAADHRRHPALPDRQARAGRPRRARHARRGAERRAPHRPARPARAPARRPPTPQPSPRLAAPRSAVAARPWRRPARAWPRGVIHSAYKHGPGRGHERAVGEQDRRAARVAADVRVEAAGRALARAPGGAGDHLRAGDRRCWRAWGLSQA